MSSRRMVGKEQKHAITHACSALLGYGIVVRHLFMDALQLFVYNSLGLIFFPWLISKPGSDAVIYVHMRRKRPVGLRLFLEFGVLPQANEVDHLPA